MTDFSLSNVNYSTNSITLSDNNGSRLMDMNLIPLVKDTFDYISTKPFGYLVTKGKKYGLLSNTGKYMLPCEYDNLQQLSAVNNIILYIAFKNKKYTLVDHLGKNILGDTYDLMVSPSYSSANLLVKKGNKMGLKDILNHDLIPMIYDTINNNSNSNYSGKYLAQKSNSLTVYNSSGNAIEEIEADKVEQLSYNYIVYFKNGKAGLLSNNFEILGKPLYDKVDYLGTSSYGYSDSDYDQFRVTQNGKMGVITKSKVIIPSNYDLITKLASKYFLVKQNGKYGVIKASDGKVLAECKYDVISTDSRYSYSQILQGAIGSEITTINAN